VEWFALFAHFYHLTRFPPLRTPYPLFFPPDGFPLLLFCPLSVVVINSPAFQELDFPPFPTTPFLGVLGRQSCVPCPSFFFFLSPGQKVRGNIHFFPPIVFTQLFFLSLGLPQFLSYSLWSTPRRPPKGSRTSSRLRPFLQLKVAYVFRGVFFFCSFRIPSQ